LTPKAQQRNEFLEAGAIVLLKANKGFALGAVTRVRRAMPDIVVSWFTE
jgi:hypothetical protein